MAKKLWSIFGSLDKCLVTGMTTGLERHHIFGGRMGFKKKSEELGYIVALHRSIHVNGTSLERDVNWIDLDHWLKRKCQEYFIDVQCHSRQEWYDIFGRYWDDRADEKVWMNQDGKEWVWDLRKEK